MARRHFASATTSQTTAGSPKISPLAIFNILVNQTLTEWWSHQQKRNCNRSVVLIKSREELETSLRKVMEAVDCWSEQEYCCTVCQGWGQMYDWSVVLRAAVGFIDNGQLLADTSQQSGQLLYVEQRQTPKDRAKKMCFSMQYWVLSFFSAEGSLNGTSQWSNITYFPQNYFTHKCTCAARVKTNSIGQNG